MCRCVCALVGGARLCECVRVTFAYQVKRSRGGIVETPNIVSLHDAMLISNSVNED